jgi:hypothetical protein
MRSERHTAEAVHPVVRHLRGLPAAVLLAMAAAALLAGGASSSAALAADGGEILQDDGTGDTDDGSPDDPDEPSPPDGGGQTPPVTPPTEPGPPDPTPTPTATPTPTPTATPTPTPTATPTPTPTATPSPTPTATPTPTPTATPSPTPTATPSPTPTMSASPSPAPGGTTPSTASPPSGTSSAASGPRPSPGSTALAPLAGTYLTPPGSTAALTGGATATDPVAAAEEAIPIPRVGARPPEPRGDETAGDAAADETPRPREPTDTPTGTAEDADDEVSVAMQPPAASGGGGRGLVPAVLATSLLALLGGAVAYRRGGPPPARTPQDEPPGHLVGSMSAAPASTSGSPALQTESPASTVATAARPASRARRDRVRPGYAISPALARGRRDMGLAAVSLGLLPVGVAVALAALYDAGLGGLTARPVGWLAAALAGALTWVGVRWILALPDTRPRLLGRRDEYLQRRLLWAQEVAASLATAQTYAAAGSSARQALELAARDDPTSPINRALSATGSAGAEPWDPDDLRLATFLETVQDAPNGSVAGQLLDQGARLAHEERDRALDRQLQLLSVRALGPLLLCFVPAAALVVAATML